MMQALTSAVALAVLVTLADTNVLSTPGNEEDFVPRPILCPPFFSRVNGECIPDPVFADEINAARRKRQATTPTCPYCAQGVWDLYPNWNNCSMFYLCLNGNIVDLDCPRLGALFFNPTNRQCESVRSSSNICLHRTVNL